MSSLFEDKSLYAFPARLEEPFSWVGHIPLALYLVKLQRPETLVELGVHTGNSFSAFCQGVSLANYNTQCYGVDTWVGDEHAGFYENSVYENLLSHVASRYAGFGHLLRMTFDRALDTFEDKTIDLLHIDGLHTYEAVLHDFETWLPKVSKRGIVILHDTAVRTGDFGVWKLWEQIAAKYPCAELSHAFGLGIAAVGPEPVPEVLDLFDQVNNSETVRAYFERMGDSLLLVAAQLEAARQQERAQALESSLREHIRQLTDEQTRFHEVVSGNNRHFRELENYAKAELREKEEAIKKLEAELADLREKQTDPLRSNAGRR